MTRAAARGVIPDAMADDETTPRLIDPIPVDQPLDWNDVSQVYRYILNRPYKDVEILAEGKRPEGWCPVVTGLHVRVARECVSAGRKGSAAEMNARAYGPVSPGKIEGEGAGFTVNVGLVRK